jgi:hypothetical protein
MEGPDLSLVFRHSPLGAFAALPLTVCVTPVAFAAPGLLLLYLIPVAVIVWVLRTRTTADGDTISVRGALRTRRVAWGDVTAVRLRSSRTRSGISAVLRGGSELTLPAVRVGDLPALAAVSGGRLPDPGPATDGEDPDPAQPATTEQTRDTDPPTTEPPGSTEPRATEPTAPAPEE